NYVGTDVTGTKALPNTNGIFLEAPGNTVGGTAAGAGNVISGNAQTGIYLSDVLAAASGNVIQGNFIGTDASGTKALGNVLDGVDLFQTGTQGVANNRIGGSAAGAGNLIANNGRNGV